ncbi:MAG: co-chaperone GroES [Spirochaetes bacterium GWF1_31_7]|nr:MAG: co-chaperone GroES [Spirochaetes bacterium GWE1_32_154]OHD52892.1 MAG: co-chaperone GroES [Spirochaetes bacterium GWE2_31_10]OHD53153.1 MAG: co-chaperone GroES [Spirochaetes bacterium GWF1_31_7]OHD80630.1 MAG: co-chaperone GroES [Spirochaetes bacterium RIFOXYB1_FULL_32_8]HBD93574.1 co-chaperone GroES [Spirochaetia bacterium]
MAIRPIGDRVLIKVKDSETKTSGGLVIPQTSQEKTQEGTIVSVGEVDNKVKAGDVVMYDKYAGTQLKIDGKDHLIIKTEEILAVIS